MNNILIKNSLLNNKISNNKHLLYLIPQNNPWIFKPNNSFFLFCVYNLIFGTLGSSVGYILGNVAGKTFFFTKPIFGSLFGTYFMSLAYSSAEIINFGKISQKANPAITWIVFSALNSFILTITTAKLFSSF